MLKNETGNIGKDNGWKWIASTFW